MSGVFGHEKGNRILGALGLAAATLRTRAKERIDRLGATWRMEVQRVAIALTLALILAFFVCAAAAFAMFSLLLAFWDTHRVAAAGSIAAGFALLAWIAARLLRGSTQPAVPKDEGTNTNP